MKRLIAILLIMFNANFYMLFSQNYDEDPGNFEDFDVQQLVNKLFGNLNTSNIETGLLYDRIILPLSGIEYYDGQSDSLINQDIWYQLYFELSEFASTGKYNFAKVDSIKSRATEHIKNNLIPIAIINFNYNSIRPTAIDSGLIYLQNERLYENANNTISPYDTKQVYAATTLSKSTYRGNVTFLLDSNFYFSNVTDSLLFFQIDFGDGRGFRKVNMGEQININYTYDALSEIKVRAVYQNKNYISNSSFEVYGTLGNRSENITPDDVWDIYIQSPTYPSVPYIAARAYIKYGCGNENKLRKPLIFVEGIDFGSEDLPYEYRYGDFGWNQVITGNAEGLVLYKLPDLIKKLNADGYDLIMLDFKEGAIDIKINAKTLVKLIQMVNSELTSNGSNSKLVVLGASMGGQVSRYALNYMENNGYNHNTSMWISFDSPNEGANISLGMQYAIRFLTPFVTSMFVKPLFAKASKQLLLYHFLPTSGKTARQCQERTDLYNDINMQGYPSKPLKVGISNGSRKGFNQGYFAGSLLVNTIVR